jgi:hypothetical protein
VSVFTGAYYTYRRRWIALSRDSAALLIDVDHCVISAIDVDSSTSGMAQQIVRLEALPPAVRSPDGDAVGFRFQSQRAAAQVGPLPARRPPCATV